ncbi:MAG: Holliday junction ATP-dependent DNA helicase RuvA [Elusimicrobiales bacterium]|nr:Holliday junction ATP-dependent DNA helicase RuvA [Elusimicrobiales bacterium]
MIAYLKGEILKKREASVILVAGGVGYEVNLAQAALDSLSENAAAELYVSESISPYDGTVLYGFRSEQEKELFKLFKEAVPNTGAKKALDLLNKALKSLPDFRRAIVSRDARLLTGIFGFTGKTAEKLIVSLKDKMSEMPDLGAGKISLAQDASPCGAAVVQVFDALTSLGYSASEAKKAVESLHSEGIAPDETVEALLRRALKRTSP